MKRSSPWVCRGGRFTFRSAVSGRAIALCRIWSSGNPAAGTEKDACRSAACSPSFPWLPAVPRRQGPHLRVALFPPALAAVGRKEPGRLQGRHRPRRPLTSSAVSMPSKSFSPRFPRT